MLQMRIQTYFEFTLYIFSLVLISQSILATTLQQQQQKFHEFYLVCLHCLIVNCSLVCSVVI